MSVNTSTNYLTDRMQYMRLTRALSELVMCSTAAVLSPCSPCAPQTSTHKNTLNILQWLDVLVMSRSRGFCSLQNVNKTRAIVTDFRGERKATRPTSSERILMRSRKKGPDRALELTSTG